MNTGNSGIENQQPRFEFRSFGQDFKLAAKRMARLSIPVPEQFWDYSSDEIYIISPENNTYNIKIRGNKLTTKELVQTIGGFEQWKPLPEVTFPVSVSVLKDQVFPALKIPMQENRFSANTAADFIATIDQHPALRSVKLHKQRFAYNVNNCICETGIVLINGASVFTISIESTNIEDIRKTITETRLEGTENINYLQMIMRVTGMINKPLAN